MPLNSTFSVDLLFSIKKTKKNKIVEVQRSDLIGQYLGSTTEKAKQKIVEARGGVLFIDEAYRLISTAGGKDFGREAIEELMAVMEDGDPVMIFAGYEDKMEKFLNVNPGLRSRIYRKFTFLDYSTDELGEMFSSKGQTRGIPSGCQCGRNSRCVHITCLKKKYECTPGTNLVSRKC